MYYAFSIRHCRLTGCQDCGFLALFPQPSDDDLLAIYGDDYTLLNESPARRAHFTALKQATARHYMDLIGRYRGGHGGRLLEVGCGGGDLLEVALSLGYQVTGLEFSRHACETARQLLNGKGEVIQGELETILNRREPYDICILADVLEHVRNPRAFLESIYNVLKADGLLFIATPSLDSWSAKLLRHNWMEFKLEHLHYFDQNTLHSLLFQTGFHHTVPFRGVKTLSIEYILEHFERYPVRRVSTVLRLLRILPAGWRRKPLKVVASGMIAMATKAKRAPQRKLSIILPAYNEAATLETLLRQVLEKELDGLEKEIILVESNSSDGTREIAMRYENHPHVKVVLEDRPRGKGHAVRTGMAHATGDFVLIQDADLEYDLEDYDVLLEPLLNGRRAFVMGSRHGGRTWKLRGFTGQPVLSVLFNFGHQCFRTLVNLLYGLHLSDPFTMYKLFRRDLLSGVKLECNHFDFDYELLLKLVRKGYKPIEIPVNYRSRSFQDGKKVSILRDPWTWLRAILKYRFVSSESFQVTSGALSGAIGTAGNPVPGNVEDSVPVEPGGGK